MLGGRIRHHRALKPRPSPSRPVGINCMPLHTEGKATCIHHPNQPVRHAFNPCPEFIEGFNLRTSFALTCNRP
jgi:hypothetical protein